MSILILGSSSGAGKTTVSAMICRYLHRKGVDVAPFKGSNLSSESFKTDDGGEIGSGQVFQAFASGVKPSADMNPLMIKFKDGRLTHMLRGKKTDVSDHETLMAEVTESFNRLSDEHDVLVCEGSGSPVELNLMDRDVANTGLMRSTGVPAILVVDIERGGAFAVTYGTWLLMPKDLRPQLKGYVINRFRGDASILDTGMEWIESRTGLKCLGVLRYEHLDFPAEDILSTNHGSDDADMIEYLSNLDTMIEHAEEDGFDFEMLEKILSDSSA